MTDDSSQISTMKFKRPKYGVLWFGDVTGWVDKKFPDCPLCKKHSPLWEWAYQRPRGYFRCPDCMGIISVHAWILRKWGSPLQYALARKVAKIESIGNNSGLQYLVGQEYPIKEIQEWAHK